MTTIELLALVPFVVATVAFFIWVAVLTLRR